jgi:hypothetical protein
MGSGEHGFGLYIFKDLASGNSARSETFDNEQLSKNATFQIQQFEVWAPVLDE